VPPEDSVSLPSNVQTELVLIEESDVDHNYWSRLGNDDLSQR
jgi:hypothetical protein